ncbi:MAG: NAD(P)H dehydrogenase (quinone) [Marivirga sp.]|jgi:NAD(P)H dehydrogenase (quinone)
MNIGILPAEGKLANSVISLLTKEESLSITAINSDALDHLEGIAASLEGVEVLALINHYNGLESKLDEHKLIIEAAKSAGVRKIVYTSIIGKENATDIAPVIHIHRATEEALKQSGLAYIILRNGLYIGADLDYIPEYRKIAKIENCSGEGLCSYTSRSEIADAFKAAILSETNNDKTFNICGQAITQDQLSHLINDVYGFDLAFENISVEKYRHLKEEALGEKYARLITGVHESINLGDFHVPSEYEALVGRPHNSILQLITEYKMVNDEAANA